MKYRTIVASWASTAALAAFANTNSIVITATRIETPINQMAATVNVITSDDLENTGTASTPDLLQTIPGISVSSSGGPGQATQLYLRGAKPQHTLVMVDGVRMNGQLDLTGYNLSNLQLFQVGRIEILKGPHSPLYGTDAMAGVINITTRPGEGAPSPFVQLEGGSYGTWRAATGIAGGDARFDYNASISHSDRQGESVQKNNDEKDGYENTTVATRVGFRPTDSTEAILSLRHIDAAGDYDDGFGTAHADYRYESEQLIARAEVKSLLASDLVETKAGISYLMLDREEFGYPSSYNADTISADWANTLFIGDNQTLLLGLDGYRDDFMFDEGFGETDDSLNNIGTFGSYQVFPVEAWVVNAGLRYDDHSEFDGETTYQASTAYTIAKTGTRLKASYGTGFKAPISYQLFSAYGNPDLKPEESKGWELGFEQHLVEDRLEAGAACFRTDFKNMIDYDLSTWTYGNIAEATSQGVEVFGTAHPVDALAIRAGYTYLDNDDKSGNTFPLRRPTHQIDAAIGYAATEKLSLNLSASYVGHRDDIGNARMYGYVLVNGSASYAISDHVTIHGRIENLLDEDYETVAGYNTDDLSAYAGIRVSM